MDFRKKAGMVPAAMSFSLLFLTGCAAMPSGEYSESSVKIFGSQSAYYQDFTAREEEDGYLVQGTARLGTDNESCIVRMISDKETTAEVIGAVDCKEGSLRLVYTAPDGTETVLAECVDASYETIDASLTVTDEESTLKLAGSGKYEVCEFEILIAGDDIDFYLGRGGTEDTEVPEATEDMEIPEVTEDVKAPEAAEDVEAPEKMEDMEIPEVTEDMEIPEMEKTVPPPEALEDPVTDNWPESIECVGDGLTGKPFCFDIPIEEAVELSLSCITEDGSLRIQIQDPDGRVVFDEDRIKKDDFRISIETPGVYRVSVWAEQFVGKFGIKPEKDIV